jgi:predicted Kef-type K+ transport protein
MVSLAIAALGSAFLYGVIAHRYNLPPISQLQAVK